MELLDTLNETVLYWHWIAFGIVIVAIEAMLPNFVLIWFGLSGVIVGLILWIVPSLSFTWQLFFWAFFSTILIALWFKFIRPTLRDRSTSGIAAASVNGESGIVIKAPDAGMSGVVRFTTPLLGEDEWEYISDEEIALGDRVYVKNISGNSLIVSKVQKS
jgi:membrane protein implicated in regulation of membrane protease activity